MKNLLNRAIIACLSIGISLQPVLWSSNSAIAAETANTIPSPTIIQPDNQTNSQESTQDLNNQGANQATMLGIMAIAAGTAMIAAGMSSVPTNAGLISAGTALVGAGMMGLMAAAQMAGNANLADYNAQKMATTSNVSNGAGKNGTIKISDSLMRDPKAAKVFGDLKKQTGMSAEDLAKGLNDGKSVGQMLGEAGKLKGTSAEGLDDSIANANSMSQDEVLDKLGLTPEELAALSKTENEANAVAQTGSSDRKPASTNTNFDAFMMGAKDQNGANSFGGANGNLSPDVQAALDKNGITDRSIFEMVNSQYKKKTPMLFGIQKKMLTPSNAVNPFANLKSDGMEI